MTKSSKFSLPNWPIRTWVGIGILSFCLIAGFSWWGWWNSWSLPNWTVAKYEYLNGPTVLEEVQEIGELVGAEYYGEVIHSLLEQQGLWVTIDCAARAMVRGNHILLDHDGFGDRVLSH